MAPAATRADVGLRVSVELDLRTYLHSTLGSRRAGGRVDRGRGVAPRCERPSPRSRGPLPEVQLQPHWSRPRGGVSGVRERGRWGWRWRWGGAAVKPHSKIRKTVKWGGAAVTVLLVLVWVGSGWADFGWISAGSSMCYNLGSGGVSVCHDTRIYSPRLCTTGWHFKPKVFWFDLWFRNLPSPFGGWYLRAPLWPVALIALFGTAGAWRLDRLARRARLNMCPKCNYDRAGLVAGVVCPECGAAIASGRLRAGP